jgi:hypothetical protein
MNCAMRTHDVSRRTMPEQKKYWFYAKRHGWGWGPSASWQGWLVRIVYAVLVGAGFHFLVGVESLGYFCAYLAAISAAAFGVCWWKGEPLRWRWGGD